MLLSVLSASFVRLSHTHTAHFAQAEHTRLDNHATHLSKLITTVPRNTDITSEPPAVRTYRHRPEC